MRWELACFVALGVLLAGCANYEDFDQDGVVDEVDCDPSDPAVHPFAEDPRGDGIDSNCDGVDGLAGDVDGDGFGAERDCDDEDPAVFPGAADPWGDDVDSDCDGCEDGAGDGVDRDCDGYAANVPGRLQDCDDEDPAIHPGEPDVAGDGVDSNCDGLDEEDADGDGSSSGTDCDDADPTVEKLDLDGDGDTTCGTDCDDLDASQHGLDADSDGWSTCDGDCNDSSTAVSPDDGDGDGLSSCDGDCDDGDPEVGPGQPEQCDGQDSDCDAGTEAPGGEQDEDGDGSPACADCDDADASRSPLLLEACDGVDNDCSGSVDGEGETDGDGDGFLRCADCNDNDASVSPAEAEACDGFDTDCDAATVFADEDVDLDADGSPACADCEDTDPSISPLFGDVLGDGVDSNCDGWDGVGDPTLPLLVPSAAALDFGVLPPFCDDAITLELSNPGGGDLVVSAADLTDPSGLLSVATPLPLTVPPGEVGELELSLAASEDEAVAATLEVQSNADNQPTVQLSVDATFDPATPTTESFVVGGGVVDVVVLLDTSASMSEEQSALSASAAALLAELQGSGLDWQLGLISMDPTDGAVLQTSPQVITPSTPNPASAFTLGIDGLGAGGGFLQLGLEQLYVLLGGDGAVAGNPTDFPRAGATVAVVAVTDDEEASVLARGWDSADYVAEMATLLGSADRLQIHTLGPGAAGCSGPSGTASAAPNWEAARTATGGTHYDVCQADWQPAWAPALATVPSLSTEFPLAADPGAAATVKVDGVPLTSGWSVDPSGPTLVLDSAPSDGAVVEIEYVLQECAELAVGDDDDAVGDYDDSALGDDDDSALGDDDDSALGDDDDVVADDDDAVGDDDDSAAPLGIEVVVTWDWAGDLDLHLLQANDGAGNAGTPLDLASDCHYANVDPDWGLPGIGEDDPVFVIDDTDGFGPENIYIPEPAGPPYDGWYQVVVVDHTSNANALSFDVTLSVRIAGVEQGPFVFDIGTGVTEWYAAEIQWPGGAVNACSGLACPNAP